MKLGGWRGAARRLLQTGVLMGTPISVGGARGLVLRGKIWTGAEASPFDGVVLIDSAGRIDRIAPTDALTIPDRLPVIGSAAHWIGPGITDTHVHLGFSHLPSQVAQGVIGMRDLGAPPAMAKKWRAMARRTGAHLATAGAILTAPGGYPTKSWGADGYGYEVASADRAREAVAVMEGAGASVIKIALEPGEGWPTPSPATTRAVVEAAHDRGLAVVAHARTVDMVHRALDAGVDELAHTPTEELPAATVDRIAEAQIPVSSTLQTFFSGGIGRPALRNATAMVEAGVPLVYGTDLGNSGTLGGVDPRELDRLAQAGLGRWGALRAATEVAARCAGLDPSLGFIREGEIARCVVLSDDPILEPGAWRAPTAVIVHGRVLRP